MTQGRVTLASKPADSNMIATDYDHYLPLQMDR